MAKMRRLIESWKTYQQQLTQPVTAADAWRKLLEVGRLRAFRRSGTHLSRRRKVGMMWSTKMQRAANLSDDAERVREFIEAATRRVEPIGEPTARQAHGKLIGVEPAHDQLSANLTSCTQRQVAGAHH